MNTRKKLLPIVAVVALLLLGALSFAIGSVPHAPVAYAQVTPVSSEDATGAFPMTVRMFNDAVAADGRGLCVNAGQYNLADIQYSINQSDTNTITLKLQHSNNGTAYVDGSSIVSANTSDASGMVQLQNFGSQTCVYADVANTNPVTVAVDVMFK